MSFYHRYELVKLVNNGDPKSFEAREIQTGQPVLLHLWSMGGDSPSASLLARMRALTDQQPATAGRLIEVQESAQPPYAVTALESGFVSLESWLGTFAPASPLAPPQFSAAAPSPPSPDRTPNLAGPTVDMPITARPVSPQAPPAMPQPPFQPPAPAPNPTPAQEVGEFTRMFQGSIAQPPVRPAAAQPASFAPSAGSFTPAPAAPPAAEPGEFTRLFAAPSQPVSPLQPAQGAGSAAPPASQPAAAGEMGEFTRLFASPSATPPPSAPAPPAPAQAFTPQAAPEFAPAPPPLATPPHPLFPAPASQPQPGAFDLSARPEQTPHAPVSQAPVPAPGSSFTGMFGGPVQQPSSPPPAYNPPPAPPAAAGPSDFEKFFASPLGASPMPLEEIERGRMAAPAPPPSAKPFRGPGDFTLQFGRDAANAPAESGPDLAYAPPPPPTPQARMSSGATGIFSAPAPDYGPGFDTPAAPSGPGEFTRIIQGPPKQSESSAPSPAPYSPPPSAVAAPVPQAKNKLLPILMAVLSVVVVALVITVVILIFKK